jgi:hypothetical protein
MVQTMRIQDGYKGRGKTLPLTSFAAALLCLVILSSQATLSKQERVLQRYRNSSQSEEVLNTWDYTRQHPASISNTASTSAHTVGKERLGACTVTLDNDSKTNLIYLYSFINGFQPDLIWTNTTACLDRITNLTMVQIPMYTCNMTTVSDLLSQSTYTTLLIQNISNHLWICNDMLRHVYWWVNYKLIVFGGATNFATGFFANMLGKVISINNIYNAIQTDQANNN